MTPLRVTRASLLAAAGQEIVVSDWLEVDQRRIDRFADATDDRQWIHVDPARAKAESPFGTTIAHGFLTLSLLAPFVMDSVAVEDLRLTINYGLERVRFVDAVPAGSRIRARFVASKVIETEHGLRVHWLATVEREGGSKPVCVAEWIVLYNR